MSGVRCRYDIAITVVACHALRCLQARIGIIGMVVVSIEHDEVGVLLQFLLERPAGTARFLAFYTFGVGTYAI